MCSLFPRDNKVVLAFVASSQFLYVEVVLALSNHLELIVAVCEQTTHTCKKMS